MLGGWRFTCYASCSFESDRSTSVPEPQQSQVNSGAQATRKRRRSAAGPRPRRVPQRTCVACRQVEGKRQLVRIVRTPQGSVEVDPTGKKNGRGAYLHADQACWDTALKRKALQHALKAELTEADRAALQGFRATLEPSTATQEDSGVDTAALATVQPESRERR